MTSLHTPGSTSESSSANEAEYRLLDSGIHEFTLLTSSRKAVDQLYEHIVEAIRNSPQDETFRCIIDQSQLSDLPPVRYLSGRVKDIDKDFPSRAPGRNAIISRGGALISILDTMVTIFARRGTDKVRFFRAEEREKAEGWLLSED